jgi:hypothetical protein
MLRDRIDDTHKEEKDAKYFTQIKFFQQIQRENICIKNKSFIQIEQKKNLLGKVFFFNRNL